MELSEKTKRVSERTLAQQRGRITAHILGHEIATVPINLFRDTHVTMWMADLREEGLKPPSINTILGPLRMAMTGAWQRELIPRRINPMALIKNLKISPSEPRIMGPDELMRVLAVCDDQRRFLYVIQAFTGMRPAEAYALAWEHIDFRGSVIRIRQQLLEHHDGRIEFTDRLKTPRSRRDISMFEIVRWAVAQLQLTNRLRSSSCPVFGP